MPKTSKQPAQIDEALAFEMIELTCDELETLTKAFQMIDTVCRELQSETEDEDSEESSFPHVH